MYDVKIHYLLTLSIGVLIADASFVPADDVLDTQKNPPPLTPAKEAAETIKLPPGFISTLFASEPDVRQPIAMTTDTRGRLWVAENYTYADSPTFYDANQRDRIIILEDTDGDGASDKRTLFWDKGEQLTSIELGFGGVWALCPPKLLFIPDKDQDDKPDGEPIVIVEGFDIGQANRHNFANGLRWGPDGWLYGRNGITHVAHVGKPGSSVADRVEIGPGMWRVHPQSHAVELVATGTTNPWGHDWNEHGELFFINTVIGHFWHVLPGAHFKRMFGADPNPYSYQLIDQTADHYHWDTREKWMEIRKGVSQTTAAAGGGHAHAGLLIYQGDNWPEEYRRKVYAINLHGRRLNVDTLERRGASYTAHHGQDAFFWSDPWFRGIDLIQSPDGGVFVADWSDVGECHEADGVHRSSGRIFKLTYGRPAPLKIKDVAALDANALIELHTHPNEWLSRQARHVLHEQAVAGKDISAVQQGLKKIFADDPDLTHKLRALWTLHLARGTTEAWILEQLGHKDEHVRSWAVRLLTDQPPVSSAVVDALAKHSGKEDSGLVLLYLASALQRIDVADRTALADELVKKAPFANDPVYPLMVWYGIEPAVAASAEVATKLATAAEIPLVRRFIARRLTQQLATNDKALDSLLAAFDNLPAGESQRDVLAGIAEGLRGVRKAPLPTSWVKLQTKVKEGKDAQALQLAREIAVVFGDGLAIDELRKLVTNTDADLSARQSAIRSLSEAQAGGILPMLQALLGDVDLGADAARGMAYFDDVPNAKFVVERLGTILPTTRAAAIETLVARPRSAKVLIDAIEKGDVARDLISVVQIRQIQSFDNKSLNEQLLKLWPELRPINASKRLQIDQLKEAITDGDFGKPNPMAGRVVWDKTCAKCHTLFGTGGKVGPDLTGSQRSNLDFVLENIIDPSATLAPSFRMSTILLNDGRVINGIVLAKTEQNWEIQTATDKVTIGADEIEETRDTNQSLMPEGLLDVLKNEETRDLIAYVMSPTQVNVAETPKDDMSQLKEMLPDLHLLEPIWSSPVIYGESILPIKRSADGAISAKLLFPAQGIIFARSANREHTLRPDEDFKMSSDGTTISISPSVRISFVSDDDLYPLASSGKGYKHRTGHPDQNMLYGEGHWFHDRQLEVTYQRKLGKAEWSGPVPKLSDKELPRTFARLRAKEPITIGVSGDSITQGYNASGYTDAPPHMPPYPNLVAAQLSASFHSPVTLHNRAIAGWSIANGIADLDKLLAEKPNLIIVAYGMNDVGRRDPEWFRGQIDTFINHVHNADSTIELILVSPMLGHPEWIHTPGEMFPKYRDVLASFVGAGIALADLTGVWEELVKKKNILDMIGNGLNHPNDFGHRLYAQTILGLLLPPIQK